MYLDKPSCFLHRVEKGETSTDLGCVLEACSYTFMTTHKYLPYCIAFFCFFCLPHQNVNSTRTGMLSGLFTMVPPSSPVVPAPHGRSWIIICGLNEYIQVAGAQRERDMSERSREGFLGTLRLEAWVGRVEDRKGKMCSGTGLREWQKQRLKESTVAKMYWNWPEGHPGSTYSSLGSRTNLVWIGFSVRVDPGMKYLNPWVRK